MTLLLQLGRGLAVASALMATPAMADPAGIADWSDDWTEALQGWKFGAQLGVATDSGSKGISETQGNGQVSAAVTASRDWAYVSARLKTVRGSDGSDDQSALAIGGRWSVGPDIHLNSQIIYKVNGGARPGSDTHFVEWQSEASRTFGRTTLKALTIWSPDSSGATKAAFYYELGAAQKLSDRWSASGGIGERRTEPKRTYTAWNAGATLALNAKMSLDLRYYDTNRHDYSKAHGDRFVVALQRRF
ncbi:porin [Asticcacaulis sp. DW145]|uniref:TorF family putative porin n=1 Tax=Asticcacaulis sp. DW145 TaxID=3095608 RepID=UPI0030865824|nr:porin [Asticcacaulis sp. DW145]